MPEPNELQKAQLREIEWDKEQVVTDKKENWVDVQFNPETLTVNLTNQKSGGDQRGGSAMQYVGSGNTKLSLDLWFDATIAQAIGGQPAPRDVRELTEKVNYFMKPVPKKVRGEDKLVPPAVRFIWGTFLFDGIMDSVNEKLEYFSEDGRPLRAMMSLSISSQSIQFQRGTQAAGGGLSTGGAPGVTPQVPARSGQTLQGLAQAVGRGNDWQQIAAANGIENPRQLDPGALVDVNADLLPGASR